jgi:hypothetical protein
MLADDGGPHGHQETSQRRSDHAGRTRPECWDRPIEAEPGRVRVHRPATRGNRSPSEIDCSRGTTPRKRADVMTRMPDAREIMYPVSQRQGFGLMLASRTQSVFWPSFTGRSRLVLAASDSLRLPPSALFQSFAIWDSKNYMVD